MWRASTRMGLANLRSRPLQTIMLGLVIALGALTLTLALAVGDQNRAPFDDFMARTSGAHAWFGPVPSSDRAALEQIAARPEVEEASDIYPMTFAESGVGGVILGVDSEPPAIGTPILRSGRWLADGATDEVVLDTTTADLLRLGPGDSFEVRTGFAPADTGATVRTTTLRVVGVAQTGPQYFPGEFGAFIHRDSMAALADGSAIDWTLAVRLKEPPSSTAFIELVEQEIAGGEPIGRADWQAVRDEIDDDARVFVIFFMVFGSFALGATGLILANIVSGVVLAARRDIGILKAVGFAPSQITGIFLGSQLALAFVVALAGSVAGFLLAPIFMTDTAKDINSSAGPQFDPATLLVVVGVISVVVVVFTWLPAWQAGRISAVRAITGWSALPQSASRLSGLARRLRLPPAAVLGLKDVFARPVRTWFTVCALAIAIATLVTTLMIEATFAEAKYDISMFGNEAYHLSIYFIPEGAPSDEAVAAVGETPGVESATRRARLEGRVPGHGAPFALNAIDGDLNDYGQRPHVGRPPREANEVMVADNMARRLGLRVGSTFVASLTTFGPGGETGARPASERTLLVTGLFREGDEDGQVAVTPMATVQDIAGRLFVTLGVRLERPRESRAMTKDIAANLTRIGLTENRSGPSATSAPGFEIFDEVEDNRADMEDTASATRPILFGLNAMLVFIAIVNVVTTLLFAVRERYRDIGILKAIGMSPRQVLASITVSACALSVVAVAVGIPAGIWFTETLFDYFGKDEGWRPGIAVTPPAWQLALLVPTGLLLAVLSAWLPARRAARLPVTEALRFE